MIYPRDVKILKASVIQINVIHPINNLQDKYHRIISVDAEKAFDKIQHSFMIKKNYSPESGHRGNLPQYYKGNMKNTANIILSGEKQKATPL